MFPWLFQKRKRLDDKKQLGRWGEQRSENFLNRKGLRTLTRNFSCRSGEIDLIMVDTDRTIVFVEVKTRTDDFFQPVESVITYDKKAKMIKSARYFLAKHDIQNRPYRFDVLTLTLNKKRKQQVQHFENAFTP